MCSKQNNENLTMVYMQQAHSPYTCAQNQQVANISVKTFDQITHTNNKKLLIP